MFPYIHRRSIQQTYQIKTYTKRQFMVMYSISHYKLALMYMVVNIVCSVLPLTPNKTVGSRKHVVKLSQSLTALRDHLNNKLFKAQSDLLSSVLFSKYLKIKDEVLMM